MGYVADVRRPAPVLVLALGLAVVLTVLTMGAAPQVEAVVRTAPGASGIGDPYFPLDGNGGIDVLSYDVHDRYHFGTGRLSGRTDLRLRGTAAVSSFDLDFLLPVRAVLVDGRAAPYHRTPHELVVERALKVGEVVTVRVRYAGRPATRSYEGESNWLANRGEVVAMNQPHMAPWWFPANDHPRDRATMRISITVPASYDVVANGRRVRRTVHGNGQATTTWREATPMAPYLAFFAAGQFRIERGTQGGRPWLVAVSRRLGASEQRAAMTVMRRTPALTRWLEGQLGPYPFDVVGGLTTSLPVGFALENQTRPTYPYLGDGENAVDTVVHELAHQWFGDSVTLQSWRDIWLNEGPATWFEWRYDEQYGGWSAARRLRAAYDETAADDPFWAGVVADPCPAHRGCVDRIFDSFVYDRGAMTLQALRNRLGDAVFTTVLRRWVGDRRGGSGSTAQFEALAAQVSGQDLTGFFAAWLHSPTKPADTTANGLGP